MAGDPSSPADPPLRLVPAVPVVLAAPVPVPVAELATVDAVPPVDEAEEVPDPGTVDQVNPLGSFGSAVKVTCAFQSSANLPWVFAQATPVSHVPVVPS